MRKVSHKLQQDEGQWPEIRWTDGINVNHELEGHYVCSSTNITGHLFKNKPTHET